MLVKEKCRGRDLDEEQIKIRDIIVEKLNSGEYKEIKRSCLCGSTDETVIATEDRYGIPLTTVICKKCGLVRCNPYYDEATVNSFYSNYYRPLYTSAKCTDTLFETRISRGEKIINNIEKYMNIKIADQKVYEIGCASGAILKAFKNRGCDVYGCDYGTEWIKYGKSKGISIDNGSYEKLEQYGKADIIILSHVLEHTLNPVDFLKGIRSLLKDDTIFYISLPTIETIPTVYKNDIFNYIQNAHIYCFSNNTAKYVVEIAGYKVDKILPKEGVFICSKADLARKKSDINEKEYERVLCCFKKYESKYKIKRFINNIFSVRNVREDGKKKKQIIFLGLRIII